MNPLNVFCISLILLLGLVGCGSQPKDVESSPKPVKVIRERKPPKKLDTRSSKNIYSKRTSDRIIRKRRRRFEECQKEFPNQKGAMTVRWRIDQKGRTDQFAVLDSDLDEDFQACVIQRLQKTTFPPPKPGIYPYTQYRFRF